MSFSKHVKGLCVQDGQPYGCAATRFEGDALLPQTRESSVPHCIGCPTNTTIMYDHCKSHAHWVNTTQLVENALALPTCSKDTEWDCVDDFDGLKDAKIYLARTECRTYTGNAVENTRDVYEKLGTNATGI